MRNRLSGPVVFVVLALVPALAGARGGGGIEYLTSIGPELLRKLPMPDDSLLVLPTGSVHAISGFGYGVTRGGWKIGGFGTCFFTTPLDVPLDALDGTLEGAAGGLGGVISGGHARWRALTMALNTRLGLGGLGARYSSVSSWDGERYTTTVGTFAFYGAADLELGVLFVPAMMISAFAGVDAVVAISSGAVVPAAVPSMGIRVTWGRF